MNSSIDQAIKNWKPGDWICPHCKNHNFQSRQRCFKCDSFKDGEPSRMAASNKQPQGLLGAFASGLRFAGRNHLNNAPQFSWRWGGKQDQSSSSSGSSSSRSSSGSRSPSKSRKSRRDRSRSRSRDRRNRSRSRDRRRSERGGGDREKVNGDKEKSSGRRSRRSRRSRR